jgi:phosphohistidine phosphatase
VKSVRQAPERMPTLLLLRHAKSSWDEPALADHERPLAPRGRRAAKLIAEHISRERIEPGVVLCSSAVRAVETLDLLRAALGAGASVKVEDELYSASADRLLERVRRLPNDVASAMLIGHNPALERLALTLASSGAELKRLEEKFPTAALATLEFAATTWSRLAPGEAVLAAYVVPRDLRRSD